MDGAANFTAEDITRSLTNWWAIAGVDEAVVDEPKCWFEPEVTPATNQIAPAERASAQEALVATAGVALADWPKDVATLQAEIAAGALLPGNMFGGKSVIPFGKAHAKLMVISDIPDADECIAGQIGNGASGRLLTAMLAAIGISMDEIYWMSLATTLPAAGDLPETALPPLSEFAQHQMEMVQPGAYILLGSSVSKALLGEDLMAARDSLRNFNHDVRKKAVLTTFHPRTLIARPAMKAQAWKDLQMLTKRDDL